MLMAEKSEERCSRLMQQRLRKYDIVEPLVIQREADDINGHIAEICNEENVTGAEKVTALSVLENLYMDKQKELSYIFEELTQTTRPRIDLNVPEAIRDIYQRSMDNLEVFLQGAWWVYEKDVLRAVSYHVYVDNYKTSNDEIVIGGPYYERESYLNLPIDMKIDLESSNRPCYVCPEIGGGIINKAHWCGSKTNFRSIFLKNSAEFEISRKYNIKREKGINYEFLREGIEDITANIKSQADIWFLKNVLDPELFTCVYLALKGNSILQCDRELIWILSGCKCPSIRLYVLEAIMPCYRYVKELFKSDDVIMNFLLEKLSLVIDKINIIFQNMVNTAAFCFRNYPMGGKEKAKDSKLKEVFQQGDDFPFLFENTDTELIQHSEDWLVSGGGGICTYTSEDEEVKRKPEHRTSVSKTYSEYMLKTDELCMNKIAYCVITALNEQWNLSARKKDEKRDFEEEMVKIQRAYNTRLLYHLRGKR